MKRIDVKNDVLKKALLKKNSDVNEVLKTELDDLKSYLPQGWAKTTAEQLEVSESTVRHAANGRFNNKRVVLYLIKLAKDEKATILETLES